MGPELQFSCSLRIRLAEVLRLGPRNRTSLRLAAFFSDYDGTLAPETLPRDESVIPTSVEKVLRKISGRIPVAIVTSKDFDFIYPRTSFAQAWACVCGLEIRLANGRTISSKISPHMETVLRRLDNEECKSLFIETKRDVKGRLLGISIDWTKAKKPAGETLAWIKGLSRGGMHVDYDRFHTFIDVFAGRPDKGRSLKELKRLLEVEGAVMFIGDSPLDNSAFKEADLSVGVSHGQPLDELDCEFLVNHDMLEGFLSSLLKRGLDFTLALPGVRKLGVGQRC